MSETKKMIVDVPVEVHELVKEYQRLLKDAMYLEQGVEPLEKNRYKVKGRQKPLPDVLSILLLEVKRDIAVVVNDLKNENEKLLNNLKTKNDE
jgi:hypothetical protein